jgi:hypothetical protein
MAPDTLSLDGKVAIITGSGKENGIGAGIATALARNGAWVTINYVSDSTASRAANLAKKIESEGGKVTVVHADISTTEGAARLVKETLKAFNVDRIDILGRLATIFLSFFLPVPFPCVCAHIYRDSKLTHHVRFMKCSQQRKHGSSGPLDACHQRVNRKDIRSHRLRAHIPNASGCARHAPWWAHHQHRLDSVEDGSSWYTHLRSSQSRHGYPDVYCGNGGAYSFDI